MIARFRSKNIARSLVAGFVAAATVATCAAQSGQAQQPQQRPTTGATKTSAPPAVPPAAVVAAPGVTLPPEYIIGADDVLSIVFWRDKELSTEVAVRPDGNISIPLINDVRAAGLTPAQLKDKIVDESKKYVEDPNVTVVVKSINSRKVFITGEVKKPGPYPLSGATTILQLISIAGGLGDYAKSEKITIVRMDSNGKPVSYRFNYKEVLDQKKLAQNIELKPGDTVIVP